MGFLTEQDSLKLYGLDEFVVNPGSSHCPQLNHSELYLWRRYVLLGMTWFGCYWSFQVEAIEDQCKSRSFRVSLVQLFEKVHNEKVEFCKSA